MMQRGIEQGSYQYSVERALTLHKQLSGLLNTRVQRGEAILAGKNTEGVLLVAPPTSIYNSRDLDKFQTELFPGIEPDLKIASVDSFLDKKGGLSFGLLIFDNVPGFINMRGRIAPDSAFGLTDYDKLEDLISRAGKPEYELVRRTVIQTLPDANLAKAILEAERLGVRLRDGLEEKELRALKTDPEDFFKRFKTKVTRLSEPLYLGDLSFRQAQRDPLRPVVGVRL